MCLYGRGTPLRAGITIIISTSQLASSGTISASCPVVTVTQGTARYHVEGLSWGHSGPREWITAFVLQKFCAFHFCVFWPSRFPHHVFIFFLVTCHICYFNFGRQAIKIRISSSSWKSKYLATMPLQVMLGFGHNRAKDSWLTVPMRLLKHKHSCVTWTEFLPSSCGPPSPFGEEPTSKKTQHLYSKQAQGRGGSQAFWSRSHLAFRPLIQHSVWECERWSIASRRRIHHLHSHEPGNGELEGDRETENSLERQTCSPDLTVLGWGERVTFSRSTWWGGRETWSPRGRCSGPGGLLRWHQ